MRLVLHRATQPLQPLEVRQRLGQREALLVKAEPAAEHVLRDVVGAAGAGLEGALVLVEPLGVVHGDLLRAGGGPVDHAAVAGVDDRRRELLDALQRLQVGAQRVGVVVLPAPDVGRDLVEQHVAAEHAAAVLPEQDDVTVGVARHDEDVERLAREVERVALVDEVRRLDRRDRQLVLLVDGALGVLDGHAVGDEVAPEARCGLRVDPGADRQLAVAPALHDLRRLRELGEARARPDVIGVVVRDHEAAHERIAEQRERLAPAPAGAGRAEAAVDQRPALGVVDGVAVDVIERPRQRLRDAVHATAEVLDLELAPRTRAQGAVRPCATNAACVTGIVCSKCRSAASA